MSKRTRGTRRNPHQRPARRPAAGRPVRSQLETAELAADAIERGQYATAAQELEAVEEPEPVAQPRGRRDRPSSAPRPGSSLAAKAASEYVYVGQDLRRIAMVAGGLFAIMGVLFVLFQVVGVVRL